MKVQIKVGSNKGEIDKAIHQLKLKKKGFNAAKHFGKVKWDIDGLTYQKRVRNEWQ